MARLTTKQRNALPASAFAGPNRSYPVNDKAHARNAKARAAQFASPALKKKIDARADRVLGRTKKKAPPSHAADKARRNRDMVGFMRGR